MGRARELLVVMENRREIYLFPLAFLLNASSMTILLIAVGVMGQPMPNVVIYPQPLQREARSRVFSLNWVNPFRNGSASSESVHVPQLLQRNQPAHCLAN